MILITRPQPEADILAKELESVGHTCFVEPLLNIVSTNEKKPDFTACQGLVFTSPNAVRTLTNTTKQGRSLPVWTVGKATFKQAVKAGFLKVTSAEGSVCDLATMINQECSLDPSQPLLHVRGKEVAANTEHLYKINKCPINSVMIYETHTAANLSHELLEHIKRKKISNVLLFSPKTAHIFATLLKKHTVEAYFDTVRAICISDNTADRVRHLKWKKLEIAEKPDKTHIVSLIDME